MAVEQRGRPGRASHFLTAGVVVVVLVAAGCDWTQLGGSAARTGFQPIETSLNTGNVGELAFQWVGPQLPAAQATSSSSPAVVNGVVYVGAGDGRVYAYDAVGQGCSGYPTTCQPRWTGVTGGRIGGSPAVVGGVVYVGADDHKLYAFDAAGTTGCSGAPKTCSPLWTATAGGAVATPAVADGAVYVGSSDHKLYAFDAAGTTGCSGAPKTCSPLWTATTGDSIVGMPAVTGGVAYVGS